MGEVVNLRLRRKQKARAEKERRAEENRRRYGRTRAERETEHLERALEKARLDRHLRSAPAGDKTRP
ncbi:DUF4169 family protein [Chelativorans sp. SCAU2101]|uniref:DUF4169 family protein n=1 Tax=Chelativorans petroleitrophicus TaxID=2975484 RepID=A0A9X2X9Y2_9HYPH|nr:DUF4169 family protein [Chelativorans petroleitrophicus]